MGLEGKLTDMPMVDLLRVFQRSGRSGKLVIWTEQEWALIGLMEGQVVSAIVLNKATQHPLHSGEHAIYHLFLWSDGYFRYSPERLTQNDSNPSTIRRSTNALIIEALRRRKPGSSLRSAGDLTLQTPLSVLPQPNGPDEQVRMSMEEWTVLMRIGQQTTAREVVAQTGMEPAEVLLIVAQLIDNGMVMAVPLADLPQRQLTIELPHASVEQGIATGPITNLTRAIRRRLQQIAVGA